MILWGTPHALWLLLVIPILIWWEWKGQKHSSGIRYSSIKTLSTIKPTRALKWRHSLAVLRILFIALSILALARPQKGETLQEVSTEGVDMMLALDISTSMKTMDFKPKNRLNVAKIVMEDFIGGRKSDRMGLVVFGSKAFTQCPLTLDYGVLIGFLKQVDFGLVADGTAIGTAILTSANRLKDSKAKSKVIVLLTDGENNSGEIDPITAAKAAKALGIKIYTVGVGKEGEQPLEIDDPLFGKRIISVPTKVDEVLLKQIAKLTGAEYNRAQDPKALSAIYKRIDQLEKTEIQTQEYTRTYELFTPILVIALILLMLETILSHTRFMKIP